MAPNPRVLTAFSAMKALGIPEETVRPVLRKLLKVYDKNWELIEEENYRVLADAIFEYEEEKLVGEAKKREEAGPSLERSQLKQHEDQHTLDDNFRTYSDETLLTRKKQVGPSPKTNLQNEAAKPSQLCLGKRKAEQEPVLPKLEVGDKRREPFSSQTHFTGKGKELVPSPGPDRAENSAPCIEGNSIVPTTVSPQPHLRLNRKEPVSSPNGSRQKIIASEGSSSGFHANESEVRPGTVKVPNQYRDDYSLIKPKSEPHRDDFRQFEQPLAVIYPPHEGTKSRIEDPILTDGHSIGNDFSEKADGPEYAVPQHEVGEDEGRGDADTGCKTVRKLELANSPDDSSDKFEIASSPLGEVKICLTFNFANRPSDFHVPSVDKALKLVEDKYLNTYKIVDPNFSLMKMMNEVCQCFLKIGTSSTEDKLENLTKMAPSTEDKLENLTNVVPNISLLKKFSVQKEFGIRSHLHMLANSSNELPGSHSLLKVLTPHIPSLLTLDGHRTVLPQPNVHGKTNDERDEKKHLQGYQSSNSSCLLVVQKNKFTLDDVLPLHNAEDISKGEEKIKISVVNEINSEPYPSKFYYIPQNIVYQSAYVNFSLARIGDEDCCINCFDDCMSSSIPCACARETGGEFAYTTEGLVKKEFLDECISMKLNPLDYHFFYCKECPLERSKNEDLPDPCQGHLVKKFIKECWSKCGCNKYCGNRVVQRGITRNLQVFLTPQGKGWGLRALEYLPRGTFVCEYVGEILTNTELYERNTRRTGYERHTYPVLLDADWDSEGVLKDEEALCLDATSYGNVARFINHRCYDGNLIEIPVEIETPDHHYYRLAFFTTRNVDALEELTWDYGIDFEDRDHPVKAFLCKCGSQKCRNMRRKRSKQRAAFPSPI